MVTTLIDKISISTNSTLFHYFGLISLPYSGLGISEYSVANKLPNKSSQLYLPNRCSKSLYYFSVPPFLDTLKLVVKRLWDGPLASSGFQSAT